jgi:flagellar hook-associated protein 2
MSVIDGISSGLDTTGIINSLIAIEKQPINALNARIAAETNKASALQTIQSFFANINTASRALTSSTTFTATTATSSDTTRLGVTAAPGANPGNVSVRIHQLATTQQAMTATGLGSSATLTGAGKRTRRHRHHARRRRGGRSPEARHHRRRRRPDGRHPRE